MVIHISKECLILTQHFKTGEFMAEKPNLTECDVIELKDYVETGARNLIDVREYPEFAGGRVNGARLIPLGDIDKRYTEIDRDKTTYLICRSGKRGSEAQKNCVRLMKLSW